MSKSVPKLFYKCLFTFVFFAKSLYAADLHLVAVGDFAAKDLLSGLQYDIISIQNQALQIAEHTGLDLCYTSITEGVDTANQVINTLLDLNTEEEDVILFYYTGHGYRTRNQLSNWPNLHFMYKETGIELDLIITLLKKQKAHLSIIFADCCNNILEDFLAPPLICAQSKGVDMSTQVVRNYTKLFLETNGLVVAASSAAGQYSYSIDEYGGLFTQAFLMAFNDSMLNTPTENLEWNSILKAASQLTIDHAANWRVIQSPLYIVEIEGF